MPDPAIFIDATRDGHRRRVFGLTLLERALRGVLESGLAPERIVVALAERAPEPELRADLARKLPLRVCRSSAAVGERIAQARSEAPGGALLAFSADCVVDPRLLAHLARAGESRAFVEQGEGGAGPGAAVIVLSPAAPGPDRASASVAEAAAQGIAQGDLKPFVEADFDGYVQKLRRQVAPHLFQVDGPAAVKRVEKFLFWSNYKGSTDFMTRYVYPPLVWTLVRPLARMRVHPNWITSLNWIATLGCIPLFAAGAWVPGLGLAYLMSVMDSVDGKLARLTYTSSVIGDLMDHGLDIVHPPFWYMAWAYALGGGDTASLPYQASLWMLGMYAADRIATAIFRQHTGRSIHGATPLDIRMRTFISRRNVNLAVFTLALAADAVARTSFLALGALYLIVGWQAFSFAWHCQRLWAFWGKRLG